MHTKDDLNNLSRSLMAVHKTLLNFQKEAHEELEGKKLTVHEVFNLSLGHPDFAWLRKISALIVQIDESVDDKKTDFNSRYIDFAQELKELFFEGDERTGFKTRLAPILQKIPGFHLELADLKSRIDVKPILQ